MIPAKIRVFGDVKGNPIGYPDPTSKSGSMKHHNVVTRAFILIRRWQFDEGKKRFLHRTTRISAEDTINADLHGDCPSNNEADFYRLLLPGIV